MEKKVMTIVLVFLSLVGSGFRPAGNSMLTVEVTNLEDRALTKVWVSVFSEVSFLEKSIQTKSMVVSGNKAIIEFDLPAGEYAISTYQDTNGNGKLDRYIIGKPKEPYGFSNNVRPFGPPNYNDCKFVLGDSSKTISIKLIN